MGAGTHTDNAAKESGKAAGCVPCVVRGGYHAVVCTVQLWASLRPERKICNMQHKSHVRGEGFLRLIMAQAESQEKRSSTDDTATVSDIS